MSDTEAPTKADHLCVLVHGLWGKPAHLDYMAAALKERYGEDHLYILCPEGNSGNFTYDGVEVGGERVVHEIEDTLQKLEAKGQKITKISVVGYSLGGLVARYAIGLLQAHGWLDKVEPMNFTTFASPHIGVRTPLKGVWDSIWNGLGPRLVSISGQQLFMVDSFRDTGRPLLSILADPESIFIQGLKRFQNRSVYGNIVNDRTTAFYTTLFTKTNPFRDLEKININYVEGYEQVIIDPEEFLLPLTPKEPETCASEAWQQSKAFLQNMPIYLLILLLLPPASTLFCINAAIQTFRSQKRIRLHVEGKNGALFGKYKVPLLVRDMQHVMDEVFESANARQEPAYLSSSDLEASDSHEKNTGKGMKSNRFNSDSSTDSESSEAGFVASQSPKLALTPGQFDIIDSLNDVGFRKYPVYIHKHRHSHAAIVHRIQKESHSEGKLVMKHWLDNGFMV
ncbi:hypothetical protein N7466_009061 [Penicillium verhagenii]|uniref:uncharacterized protein n=1 Tax=Penicillium verhagenii TaxID=1562060 RepID=UPI0025454CC0|nr:uncharacterized protein N7466_010397 [Penicillium verhagenii]XP_057019081.1 uncharacterized protein N7466_009061 [Penicillium verhagenii]KAJ5918405.1 hypothetical protein N7466_010397 [Penicillium verhagenii]KAJ5924874.1 hypothetical protein N7466_009061 [Penicillium verhagenii]